MALEGPPGLWYLYCPTEWLFIQTPDERAMSQQPDKRRRILDAAVTVFAKAGFYNSKVSQIARAAGVADGTIYLYFKSKEDILLQVFVDVLERALGEQEKALLLSDDPLEQLANFIRVHFELAGSSPALAEVITVELRQSSKFMRGTDMKLFGRYLGVVGKIVQDGQDKGIFSPDLNPRLVSRLLFGAIDELALAWAMGDRRSSLDEACEQLCNTIVYGLLPRPSQPSR